MLGRGRLVAPFRLRYHAPMNVRPAKATTAKKITASYLENAALHYLERFSSSARGLERVLKRKVDKAARLRDDVDREQAAAWIAEIVAKMTRLGYIDDAAYAEARAKTLNRQGKGRRVLAAHLAAKGVGAEDIDAALTALAQDLDGDPDWRAALNLARRRRLGPYGPPERRAERRDKDLAALARAGVPFDMARRVIDAASVEALESET